MLEMISEMEPTLYLDSGFVEEIEDFKIGEVIEMNVKARVTSLREKGDKKGICANLSINSVEVLNMKEDRKEAIRKGIPYQEHIKLKKNVAANMMENEGMNSTRM